MKQVEKLEGAELDYWVAKASGFLPEPLPNGMIVVEIEGNKTFFMPSTEWNQGGPIIEKERIELVPSFDGAGKFTDWFACITDEHCGRGPTLLIAAMRAYVSSVYGEAVEEITGE